LDMNIGGLLRFAIIEKLPNTSAWLNRLHGVPVLPRGGKRGNLIQQEPRR
jgi:hypothetical protein